MKTKKVLVLMLALALVAGFAYSGGEKEVEGIAAAPGAPQYGGTLTFADRYLYEPKNWDATTGAWMASVHYYPYLSFLVLGDVEKYGPRGTNEYAFQLHQEIPDQSLGGDLAESWEVSADGWSSTCAKDVCISTMTA